MVSSTIVALPYPFDGPRRDHGARSFPYSCARRAGKSPAAPGTRRMSAFTMLMTAPQIATIWVHHQAAGVSAWTWSAYLASALLWFWHGLRTGDRNIYLPCVGWIALDGAVIIGALVYG